MLFLQISHLIHLFQGNSSAQKCAENLFCKYLSEPTVHLKNMYIDYNSTTKHIVKGSSLCPLRIHVILETEKAISEQV